MIDFTPKLSIVIPCFNEKKFIGDAIRSALEQTYGNKEIIVVDDGSNNETKLKLKLLKEKVRIITLLKNRGVSYARNKGISAASGEFILVLDSDDYFEKKFCEKAIELLEISEGTKIISCFANRRNEKGVIIDVFKPKGGELRNMLLYNCALGSCLFRKSDWLISGGYDENFMDGFEDWEFFIRMLKKGGNVSVIPEVLFNYRIQSNSKSTLASPNKYNLFERIYQKHKLLYLENSGIVIEHLIAQLKLEYSGNFSSRKSIDYRIGFALLKPLRFIKIHLFKYMK